MLLPAVEEGASGDSFTSGGIPSANRLWRRWGVSGLVVWRRWRLPLSSLCWGCAHVEGLSWCSLRLVGAFHRPVSKPASKVLRLRLAVAASIG